MKKKNFFDIVKNNWTFLFIMSIINQFFYLSKFMIYKNIIDLLIKNNLLYHDFFKSMTLNFINLVISQIIFYFNSYFLENRISKNNHQIYLKLIKKILSYRIDFFKKSSNMNIINQFGCYLNGIELLIEKIIIDIPKVSCFILFYLMNMFCFPVEKSILIILINIGFIYIVTPLSSKQYQLNKYMNNLELNHKNKLLEISNNIEHVKLNNFQSIESTCLANIYDKYLKTKKNDRIITKFLLILNEAYNDILIFMIIMMNFFALINGRTNFGEIIYFILMSINFRLNINQLKEIYNYYQRIKEEINIVEDIFNNQEIEIIKNSAIELKHIGDISFENVYFSYSNEKPILNNLSLKFLENKINLLMGPNGSGKSTIIKLLLRFCELEISKDQNKIFCNGIDIKEFSINELRNKISFISQEPYIFNDTIWNNITYGNSGISEEKIYEICNLLDCKEWLDLNKTKITGFRGKNLTGGEKKRIQLIGNLCKESELIVFDEPSNSLDSLAIKWFVNLVKKLKEEYKKTIIITTHDIRLMDITNYVIDLNKINQMI
ncbi:ABC transporter [uncultured virus]|nr:ABC transporter [uncultured virus]